MILIEVLQKIDNLKIVYMVRKKLVILSPNKPGLWAFFLGGGQFGPLFPFFIFQEEPI